MCRRQGGSFGAEPFARRLLGLGAVLRAEARQRLVELRIALRRRFWRQCAISGLRPCPSARPVRSPARGRGGSARSGCFAWRPCATAPPPAVSFFGVPVPLIQRDGVFDLGVDIVGKRRRLQQPHRLVDVLRNAGAFLVEGRERVLRFGIAGVGGDAQQFGGAADVLRQRLSVEIEQREIIGRLGVAELGRRTPAVSTASSRLTGPPRPAEPHHRQREHAPRGRRHRRRACTIRRPWHNRA